ncbi:hypothetical protein FBF91_08195 [Campylobacter upsaliensis]|uniref:hypothetical protein n=1 Tax=Campylobacter upsaliensis TaxID=28080 RepID=UPI0012D06FE3|nr:hypothetical protein [Campylobacter upsaliensis]EAK7296976.1 hypothetical protein [Campylobacter upsaliensis]MBJ6809613.1 hypothetical protein [Campylobacter upsaliensis]
MTSKAREMLSTDLKPFDHQIEMSEQGYKILKEKGLVYLAVEERVGKSLTSILICEKTKAGKIFIITKKAALDGWVNQLEMFSHLIYKDYRMINYESLHKVANDVKKADLIILDEPHYALSSYPRPSITAKKVQQLTYDKPIIFLSATPSSQSYSQLFHQLNMTKYSPFNKYKNFYEWYRCFGLPKTKYLAGRSIVDYTEVDKEKLEKECKLSNYFISKSREEVGFKHLPVDKVEFIKLTKTTINLLESVKKTGICKVDGRTIVCDTAAKRLSVLHQIEGGTIIDNGEFIFTGQTEKIDWILRNYGDIPEVAIFYNFKAEKALLSKYFKEAKLLQSTSHAEGVDLHKIDFSIIYSMNYSAAKYTQRRARQCNMKRASPIRVIFPLTKEGMSKAVYHRVAVEKKNFTASYYEKLRKEIDG